MGISQTHMRGDCEKPGCSRDAKKTYSGEHDNTLKVCEKHYYQLVTGRPSFNPDTTIQPNINPLVWDFPSTGTDDWDTGDFISNHDLIDGVSIEYEGNEINNHPSGCNCSQCF